MWVAGDSPETGQRRDQAGHTQRLAVRSLRGTWDPTVIWRTRDPRVCGDSRSLRVGSVGRCRSDRCASLHPLPHVLPDALGVS